MNIKPCYSVVLYCQESTMHEKKIYKDIARVVFQDIMQTYEIKPGYNPGMLTLKGGTIKMFASVDEKKEIEILYMKGLCSIQGKDIFVWLDK